MIKPFAFVELVARVRALLRRPPESSSLILRCADLILDPQNSIVKRGNNEIDLTQKEFALLDYFMQNQNRPLSKETIISHVWDFDSDILPNTVEVYVGYLRSKIDKPFKKSKNLIHTKRGFGYVFGEIK